MYENHKIGLIIAVIIVLVISLIGFVYLLEITNIQNPDKPTSTPTSTPTPTPITRNRPSHPITCPLKINNPNITPAFRSAGTCR